jgi:hypothetical protein
LHGYTEEVGHIRQVNEAQPDKAPRDSTLHNTNPRKQQQKQQKQQVGGQNSQSSSNVKTLVVPRRALAVQEYARDQKTREYKEKVHAQPAKPGSSENGARDPWQARGIALRKPVVKNNCENGNAAESVQFGHFAAEQLVWGIALQ